MPLVIHQHNGKWYFFDETWTNRVGPYTTKEDAKVALKNYVENVLDRKKKEVEQ